MTLTRTYLAVKESQRHRGEIPWDVVVEGLAVFFAQVALIWGAWNYLLVKGMSERAQGGQVAIPRLSFLQVMGLKVVIDLLIG